jgi:hypothetical protein
LIVENQFALRDLFFFYFNSRVNAAPVVSVRARAARGRVNSDAGLKPFEAQGKPALRINLRPRQKRTAHPGLQSSAHQDEQGFFGCTT